MTVDCSRVGFCAWDSHQRATRVADWIVSIPHTSKLKLAAGARGSASLVLRALSRALLCARALRCAPSSERDVTLLRGGRRAARTQYVRDGAWQRSSLRRCERLGIISFLLVEVIIGSRRTRGGPAMRESIGAAMSAGRGSRAAARGRGVAHWRRETRWSVLPTVPCYIHGVQYVKSAHFSFLWRACRAGCMPSRAGVRHTGAPELSIAWCAVIKKRGSRLRLRACGRKIATRKQSRAAVETTPARSSGRQATSSRSGLGYIQETHEVATPHGRIRVVVRERDNRRRSDPGVPSMRVHEPGEQAPGYRS